MCIIIVHTHACIYHLRYTHSIIIVQITCHPSLPPSLPPLSMTTPGRGVCWSRSECEPCPSLLRPRPGSRGRGRRRKGDASKRLLRQNELRSRPPLLSSLLLSFPPLVPPSSPPHRHPGTPSLKLRPLMGQIPLWPLIARNQQTYSSKIQLIFSSHLVK